eukprot:2648657-Rhodomonas_salina.2
MINARHLLLNLPPSPAHAASGCAPESALSASAGRLLWQFSPCQLRWTPSSQGQLQVVYGGRSRVWPEVLVTVPRPGAN